MKILGLSAFYHDSAAALVDGGKIVAAAEEERFTRKKHDASFPRHAVRFCLDHAGIEVGALDAVVFYDKPLLKFERLLETYLEFAPSGFRSFAAAMPVWIKEKLFLKQMLRNSLREISGARKLPPLFFTEHHHSHAASAFFAGPFEHAAVLCMDGVGEWTTTSIWHGNGVDLQPLLEIRFPHSLGLLYSAFTQFAGFLVNSGEYKLMGLAPYGRPIYREKILAELIDLREDGSFRLNMSYFNFATGLTMTNSKFHGLFGALPRVPETPIRQLDMDLAASVQSVIELAVLRLARTARQCTGERFLCLAGGVALNCVANGKLLREGIFDDIWIQPAAGDSGGAIGCALAVAHQKFGDPRSNEVDPMANGYLGPAVDENDARQILHSLGAVFETLDDGELFSRAADRIAEGDVVGWFQGQMEFGPRALGNRSILADPRRPEMRENLNEKIKMREAFRPFAPAVPVESTLDYFNLDRPSPYMLLVAPVKDGVSLPAVTHVDSSARVQTVAASSNPRFHALLKAFGQRTGVEVLVNTSFNVRGEPIVRSCEDAYRCFMHSGIDLLVVGNMVLEKSRQPAGQWKREIELD